MQKNEFEKQVKHKMDELRLQPSDSVWLNIEPYISKKKRRKLAWIFLMALFVFLCGGYWFIDSGSKPKQDQANKILKKIGKKDSFNNRNKLLKIDVVKKDSFNKIFARTDLKRKPVATYQIQNALVKSFKKINEKKSSLQQENAKTNLSKAISSKNVQKTIFQNLKINIDESATDSVENKTQITQDTQQIKKQEYKIIPGQIITDIVVSHTNSLVKQVINDSANKNTEAKNILVQSKQRKTNEPAKSKYNLNWGLTFSAGIAGVPNKFLGSLDKSFTSPESLYSSAPDPGPYAMLPSKISSSGALIIGLFLEKNISKKKGVTLGLNYKLFSTIIKTGAKNDSSQRYSLDNSINSYRNNYHFLELPISLKVQISSKKIPLFWDAGFSISQLIQSNALQFDNSSVVYYQNNSLFNKSQIDFNTGFSASLFSNKYTSVIIGPYINYGTTKIAKEGLYKNQHFTFIGLKSQILFKR